MGRWIFLCVAVGIAIGALCAVSPGAVFMLAIAWVTSWIIYRCAPGRTRLFLTGLFLAGFTVRVLLSVGFDLGSYFAEKNLPRKTAPAVRDWDLGMEDRSRAYLRLGDSDYYSHRAYAISEFARGSREPVVLYRIQEYGWNAYPLLMGWFYFAFGFSPFSVKWLNAFIGAFLGLAIYAMGRQLFQERIARWAAVLAAFFPSLIFWSTANLKEPFFFLTTALLFVVGVQSQRERSWRRFLAELLLLAGLFQVHIGMGRPESSWILAVCWGAALFWNRAVVRWRRGPAVVLLLVLLALPFLPWNRVADVHLFGVRRHLGYTLGTGMIYHYVPEKFYRLVEFPADQIPWSELSMPRFLVYVPRALFHYLFEPLPWRTVDLLSAAAMPQMIVWDMLLPFMLAGIAVSLRGHRGGLTLFPLGTLLGWILIGALSMGNVGTLLRIRDMVTPFLLLYAGAGLWAFLYGRPEVEAPYAHG